MAGSVIFTNISVNNLMDLTVLFRWRTDGQLVYDNCSKVVLLNEYFSIVFTVDSGVIDDSRLPHTDVQNIPPIFCTLGPIFKTS